MSKDMAFDLMEAIGELGIADFVDLNKNEQVYDLPFTKQIRRCNDLIRKIEYLQDTCKDHGIAQKRIPNLADFKEARNALKEEFRTSKYGIFDQIEKQCDLKEKFISEQTKSIKDMYHNYNYLVQYKEVLSKVSKFMLQTPPAQRLSRGSNPFGTEEEAKGGRNSGEHLFNRASDTSEEDQQIGVAIQQSRALNLSTIAGIIDREEVPRLKRIIFRAARGNVLVSNIQIEKPIKEYGEGG